jgi:hypothetical protein
LGTTDGTEYVVAYGNHTFSLCPVIEDSGYYYWLQGFATIIDYNYPFTFQVWGTTVPCTIDIQEDAIFYEFYLGAYGSAPIYQTVECDGCGNVTCVSNSVTTQSVCYYQLQGTEDYFTATAADGYTFSYWTIDGNYAGDSATLYVDTEDSHVIIAYFTQN